MRCSAHASRVMSNICLTYSSLAGFTRAFVFVALVASIKIVALKYCTIHHDVFNKRAAFVLAVSLLLTVCSEEAPEEKHGLAHRVDIVAEGIKEIQPGVDFLIRTLTCSGP